MKRRLSGGGRGEKSKRVSVQTYCHPDELAIIDAAAKQRGWTRSRFLLEAALNYAAGPSAVVEASKASGGGEDEPREG